MASKKQFLTVNQENLLNRLRKLSSRREDGWVHAQDIGSANACNKLVGKGFVEVMSSSEGNSQIYFYKPTLKQ